jgi:hypothetical protein
MGPGCTAQSKVSSYKYLLCVLPIWRASCLFASSVGRQHTKEAKTFHRRHVETVNLKVKLNKKEKNSVPPRNKSISSSTSDSPTER